MGRHTLVAIQCGPSGRRALDQCVCVFLCVCIFFSLASLGLPLTADFVEEILVLLTTYQINPFIALLATTGVTFSAAYSFLYIGHDVYISSNTEYASALAAYGMALHFLYTRFAVSGFLC